MSEALAAVTELAGPVTENGAWGAAWCYGNRLETARSGRHPGADPEFAKVGEIRTDMVLFHVAPGERHGPRELLPFLRREAERQWAFCHSGTVRHPERIDTGGRIVDGRSPSEKLFLHVLSQFDVDDPLPSVERALEVLPGETDLNFLMLSADMMVASCRYDTGEGDPDKAPKLWYGTGESMRIIATRPVAAADVGWDALANGSVYALSRKRWEL
jgi:predicted glutamine amidotransferase